MWSHKRTCSLSRAAPNVDSSILLPSLNAMNVGYWAVIQIMRWLLCAKSSDIYARYATNFEADIVEFFSIDDIKFDLVRRELACELIKGGGDGFAMRASFRYEVYDGSLPLFHHLRGWMWFLCYATGYEGLRWKWTGCGMWSLWQTWWALKTVLELERHTAACDWIDNSD